MRLFHVGKDGGPYSTVTGYWLIELKKLFSVALLKFENGSRDEYHSHAFNSYSWVLSGQLVEQMLDAPYTDAKIYKPSWRPILTRRRTFHRVVSRGTTWVITFRGPWVKRWREFNPSTNKLSTLENGRVIVSERAS
jgi:hypothetical protein